MICSMMLQGCQEFVAQDRLGMGGVAQLVCNTTWYLDVRIIISDDLERTLSEVEIAVFAGRFYHELFEAIYYTAKRQGIRKITMATSPETIQDLENVGWPLREDDDGCIYIEMSPESHAELLSNRKLFEQNVGVELLLPKLSAIFYR